MNQYNTLCLTIQNAREEHILTYEAYEVTSSCQDEVGGAYLGGALARGRGLDGEGGNGDSLAPEDEGRNETELVVSEKSFRKNLRMPDSDFFQGASSGSQGRGP